MNLSRLFFFSVALAGLASAGVAQDAIKLTRTPKVGDRVTYQTKLALEIAGNKITVTGKVTEEVVKVEETGLYHVKSTYWDTKTATRNDETEQTWNPDTVVFKPNGEFVRVVADKSEAATLRLGRLNALVLPDAPVKVGDIWKHTVAGDPKTGAVAATCEYKMTGREKVGELDCAVVEQKYGETEGEHPASSESKLWIDVATGLLVKRESVLRSLPTSFATLKQVVNGTLSVSRYVAPAEVPTPGDGVPPAAG